ncbi:MAG: TonB-dependent receptor [Acidobacteria bacterium]|nr:TonB-dependent receptor [Acidobacteriota bacterium]
MTGIQSCRLLSFSFLLVSAVSAQEYRATLLGQVTDPTGAAIASANVKATREGTQVTKETATNQEGIYSIIGLDPAQYTVTITAAGFKTVIRSGIVLQTAQRLNLPVTLEVGQMTTEVTVIGEQELVQTATASRGLVFDPIKMQEIPLNGRQAFMLMRLSPGVMFTQRTFGSSGFSGTRAWDVNGSFTMNGGRTGTNQFLLNGAPISTNGTFNVSPNVEAVQEMKIMVNTYDSQYGRSGGGHVNTTLRSGTNGWHGSLFDFWRNRILDANTRQNNAAGAKRGFRNQHQYGGIIGGPIRKDKDFVFFSFEGWQERTPFPSVTSVPTADMRTGNFNTTPAGFNGPVRVFDPLTAVPCTDPSVSSQCRSGALFLRQPFPGNVIPQNRQSPIGRAILSYYPMPNFNPTALTQNFVRADNLGKYRYEQPMARYDKILTSNDRLYFLFTFQDGSEVRNSNGFDPPARTGNEPGTVRRDMNYVISYDRTMTPTRLFHVQASYNRFVQNFPDVSDYDFTYDKIGIKKLPVVDTFPTRLTPRVTVSGYNDIFGNQFINQSSRQQANLQANVSELRGRHSLKFGSEVALLMRHGKSAGRAGGQLGFNNIWSRQMRGVRVDGLDGNGVADALLGTLDSGVINYNGTFFRREPYIAGFFQDDWKVNNRLTLNLGLRWDVQFPFTELHNRVNGDWDYTTPQAFSGQVVARWRDLAAATANYPAAPSAIVGGMTFAGVNGRSRRIYNFDLSNIQPRIGIAYAITPKTVMRGGAGIFHRTATQDGLTTGFSINTNYVNSVDGGRTPRSALTGPYSLEDPFPDGVVRPFGSALGIATNVGNGVSFDPPNRPIPRTYQWSYTIERELPGRMVLEVSYVGSTTVHEPVGFQIGEMNQANWDAAQSNPAFYQQTVTNPFFGALPSASTFGTSTTIQRRDLFRRIPQFAGVTNNILPVGKVWYNGLQTRFEKRAFGDRSKAGALTWVLAYTWSKQMERAWYDAFSFEWRKPFTQVADIDRSHNFSVALIWDLPFGNGRAMFNNLPKAANLLIGGWTANANLIYQSGVPLGSWRSWEFLCGDPLSGTRTETSWFFNDRSKTSQCFRQLRPFEYTVLPSRFHSIRGHTAPQLDVMLSKKMNFTERWQLEFRAEAFNATNTPLRGDPASTNPTDGQFGILPVQQLNFSRNIQLGMRLRF